MNFLKFLSEVGELKDIKRTGWEIRKVKDPESVSDHSFRLAIMSYLYSKELGLDTEKCIKMALFHDIGEIYTKDIPNKPKGKQVMSSKKKKETEYKATKKILSKLPKYKKEIFSLWKEFEENKTKEANLVSDLDKIEMILQALEYKEKKRTKKNLEEFFQNSQSKIKTKLGKKLWKDIRREYLKL